MISSSKNLLFAIGMMLWTFALLPAWDQTEVAGIVHKRFCLGWWNSPLLESIEKIDGEESAKVPYTGTTNTRFFSYSALALALGTAAFLGCDFLKKRQAAIPEKGQFAAAISPVD